MKLVSWNVNGIRAAERKGFREVLSQISPDIVCLQETKAHKEQVPPELLNLEAGYKSEFASAVKRGYSGVASFYKASSAPKAAAKHSFKLADEEGRLLELRFKNLIVLNAYFPSGTTGEERQNQKYKFLDFISDWVGSLSTKERENLLLCGDFNICHREIDIHHPEQAAKRKLSGFLPEERRWFDDFLSRHKLVDSYRHIHGDKPHQYSWWTYRAGAKQKNLGWRIDYILLGQSLAKKLVSADIFPEALCSDHCPISVELDTNI